MIAAFQAGLLEAMVVLGTLENFHSRPLAALVGALGLIGLSYLARAVSR